MNAIQKRLLSTSCISIVIFAGAAMAADPTGGQPPIASRATAEELAIVGSERTLLESLQRTIDRSQFETNELIDSLDWSVERILEFVHNDIAFEQYPGVLRGALGTIRSRAGNSLDQALLLATLLKDSGADARIVRGNLTRDQALLLLAEMNAPRAAPPPPVDVEQWNELSAKHSISSQPRSVQGPTHEADIATTLDIAESLATLLEQHGGIPNTASDALVDEAQDYFWVEYRNGASDAWIATHPAFRNQPWEPGEVAVIDTYADEIPAQLQHHFRLAVYIERRDLGALKIHQIVPDWQRPVANMMGRSFSFFNHPSGVDEAILQTDFGEMLEASEVFVPIFEGRVLPGSSAFDLDGVPYDLDIVGAELTGATALFRTVGGKVDTAAAALHGMGVDAAADERARYLTAQWIEYTLIAPGGSERSFRRYLFDRIGDRARESGDVEKIPLERALPWQLLTSEEFIVTGGSQPDSLALDLYLSRRLDANNLLRTYGVKGTIEPKDFSGTQSRGGGANTTVLFSMLRDFDDRIYEVQSAPTYRSAPTLLALHWEPVAKDRMQFSTDIISNDRRSLAWQDRRAAWRDLIRHGVWETVVEKNALLMLDMAGHTVETPLSMFAGSDKSRPLRLLTTNRDLKSMNLTSDQMSLLQSALQSGYQVVTRNHDPSEPFTWWRTDAGSGVVLGMLSDGRGAVAVELKILMGGVAMMAMAYLGGKNMMECGAEQQAGTPIFGGPAPTVRPYECCLIDKFTPDGSIAETYAFKWAMATDTLKRQVGMDLELCRGH